MFRYVPLANRILRYYLALKLDLAFPVVRDSRVGAMLRRRVEKSIADYMRGAAPAKYHDILVPGFDFGAKRPVLDHGYLQSLHDERVKLVQSPSLSVVGPGLIQAHDGEIFETDILILANGFQTQVPLTPMTITGSDGAQLPDIWQQDGNFPSAYMGYSFDRC
jgi:cation diffusion facilitator CzcD-associated flavoprotein CzcO